MLRFATLLWSVSRVAIIMLTLRSSTACICFTGCPSSWACVRPMHAPIWCMLRAIYVRCLLSARTMWTLSRIPTQLRRRWDAHACLPAAILRDFYSGYACRVNGSSRKILGEWVLASCARLTHASSINRSLVCLRVIRKSVGLWKNQYMRVLPLIHTRIRSISCWISLWLPLYSS